MRFFLWVLVALSLGACRHGAEFEQICEAFRALQREPTLTAMDGAERTAFVEERLPGWWLYSHSEVVWDLVPDALPEARYVIFRTSAAEILGRDWRCSAMQALVPTLYWPTASYP